jgi:hypothetical protein
MRAFNNNQQHILMSQIRPYSLFTLGRMTLNQESISRYNKNENNEVTIE